MKQAVARHKIKEPLVLKVAPSSRHAFIDASKRSRNTVSRLVVMRRFPTCNRVGIAGPVTIDERQDFFHEFVHDFAVGAERSGSPGPRDGRSTNQSRSAARAVL